MIATKTFPLMVMALEGHENGGKAKKMLSPVPSPGSVYVGILLARLFKKT